MEKIKINPAKSRKMYHMFWAFCLKKGLSFRYPERLFEKHKTKFFLASILADKLGANYRDWVAAQTELLPRSPIRLSPKVLYSENSSTRYLSYMKSKPQVSTDEERETYLLSYVRSVANTRKMTFEEALNVCLKMNFLSSKLYTKFFKEYVSPKKPLHLSLEKQNGM